MDTVIDAIKDRRTRLREFARANLPSALHADLGLLGDQVLDAHAWHVYETLKSHRIDVPPAFMVSSGYYHPSTTFFVIGNDDPDSRDWKTSTEIAQKLWDSGFRDVDAGDKVCPVRISWTFTGLFIDDRFADDIEGHVALALWLSEKREVLGGSRSLDGFRHLLAANLGSAAENFWYSAWNCFDREDNVTKLPIMRTVNVETRKFLTELFSTDVKRTGLHEDCVCPCIDQNCAPVDRFFRESDFA